MTDHRRHNALGLNVTGRGEYSPREILLVGARWARCVAYPDYDLTPWLQDCRRLGVSVLLVLARESFDPSKPWSVSFRNYALRYGSLVTAWQVGNESDHESPSSWTLTPLELTVLLREARAALPDALLVGPGMVSGQPGYLDHVNLSTVDAIAVHGYGQRPEPDARAWGELPGNFGFIGNLVDSYRRFGKPIWLTEIGLSTDQVSEFFQARYCEAFLRWALAQPDLGPTFWFCYTDEMVPRFGLMRDRTIKPAWLAFQEVAGGMIEPPTPPPAPERPWWIGSGLSDALARANLEPIGGEKPRPIVPTRDGALVWVEETGETFKVPWEKV